MIFIKICQGCFFGYSLAYVFIGGGYHLNKQYKKWSVCLHDGKTSEKDEKGVDKG